jgi:hypothetical protein
MHRVAAALLILFGAFLAGCDDVNSRPPPLVVTITSPTTEATYDVNTASVTLAGSAVGGQQVVRVTWSNAATFGSGTATGIHDWSAVVPLTPGDNAITITGHNDGDDDGFDVLTVNYQPGFQLDPQAIRFDAPAGGPDPAVQTATLTFGGAGPAAWTAASDAAWLHVTPASGTIASTDTVTLTLSAVVRQDGAWLGPTSTTSAPTPRNGHVAVWTGLSMFVPWGALETDFWSYVPDTWTGPVASTGSCPSRWRASAVWTGTEVVVWGGQEGASNVATGYRYNPLANAWSAISSVGAPSARRGHTAVWTGTEMIVWGGADGGVFRNDGGRYFPLTDTWGPAPATIGAPTARGGHGAVWTGSEMIVWGGGDAGGDVATGARYNPLTDTWTGATSSAGAPVARDAFAAVWTGMEMVVWGGNDGSGYLASGARYDPASDLWRGATAIAGAPTARDGVTGVWSGSEIVLFGGHDGVSPLNDGARYRPPIDLSPGTYTGTVTVTHPAAAYIPRTLRVTLVVSP